MLKERDFIRGVIRLQRHGLVEVGVATGKWLESKSLINNTHDTGSIACSGTLDLKKHTWYKWSICKMNKKEQKNIGDNFALVKMKTQTEQQRFRDDTRQ